jgi:hypothetical protein
MTMPDPIQPEKPGREFKNYSGNFLNTCLTVLIWPLVTSISLVRYKTILVANLSLMIKRLKWGEVEAGATVKDFHAAGFDGLVK